MLLAILFHYLMLNMFRMLIQPSSGACVLFVELFHGLYCLVWCVLVLRCGLAGVVWYPDAGFSLHLDTTNKLQAPEGGCTNIRKMLSIK